MKFFAIAAAAIVIVTLAPASGQAQIVYTQSPGSYVQGEAYVAGSNDDKQYQPYTMTGLFSATVSGSSGSGVDVATYSATINQNLASNSITASGTFTSAYSVSTQPLNTVYATTQAIAFFTVSTAQPFTLTGSVTYGGISLYDTTTRAFLIIAGSGGSPQPASLSGTLSPDDIYEIGAGADVNGLGPVAPPGNASYSGGYDLTFTTAATPEPSSLLLAGLAAFGMAGYGWRRRKQAASVGVVQS
jgi:hypothetical protein